MDRINDKYGDFVITPALMMGMDDTIIDRIAFGCVKELEELYSSNYKGTDSIRLESGRRIR
jgi:hypothetical protein